MFRTIFDQEIRCLVTFIISYQLDLLAFFYRGHIFQVNLFDIAFNLFVF